MWRSLNPAATRLHKNFHRLKYSIDSLYSIDSFLMFFCLF